MSDISNSLVSSCNPDCRPPPPHTHTYCVALCACMCVCVCLLLRSPQGALRCHFLFVDMHVVVATLWARSTVPLPSVPCMCVFERARVCVCVIARRPIEQSLSDGSWPCNGTQFTLQIKRPLNHWSEYGRTHTYIHTHRHTACGPLARGFGW